MNLRIPTCALLILALLIVSATTAQAAIIVVNTLADELNNDGDCSLREAIQAANTNTAVDACNAGNSTGIDAIIFAVNGEIRLSQGLIITQALNVVGNGVGALTLRRATGGGGFAMITVDMANASHDLTLAGFTMDGAAYETNEPGSAIQIRQVDQLEISRMAFKSNTNSAIASVPELHPGNTINKVTIDECEFFFNSGARLGVGLGGGGALRLLEIPELVVRRSVFGGNYVLGVAGYGGAIRLSGYLTATIIDSFFSRNYTQHSQESGGGAVAASGASMSSTLSVQRTTFYRNVSGASFGGDGLSIANTSASIVNSVFNDTGVGLNVVTGTAQVSHSTFHGTNRVEGLIRSNGTTQIRRSSIYGRAGEAAVLCTRVNAGTITTGGFNRYQQGDTSCGSGGSDLPVDDPRLLSLEHYGGSVPTLLPRIDSPLIDDASLSCTDGQNNPISDDARGFPRPVAASGGLARCDVGAVEWNPAFDDYLFKNGFNY